MLYQLSLDLIHNSNINFREEIDNFSVQLFRVQDIIAKPSDKRTNLEEEVIWLDVNLMDIIDKKIQWGSDNNYI